MEGYLMKLFKKLVLTALLVPSSVVFASQPPSIFKNLVSSFSVTPPTSSVVVPSPVVVAPEMPKIDQIPVETIESNLIQAVPGFCNGVSKLGIAFTRFFILKGSKAFSNFGDWCAENPNYFGAGAIAVGLGILSYKYFSRPAFVRGGEWIIERMPGPVRRVLVRSAQPLPAAAPQLPQQVIEVAEESLR